MCLIVIFSTFPALPREATKDMMAGAKEKGILGKGGGGPAAKIEEPIVEETFEEEDDKAKGKGGKGGKDKKGKKGK